MVKKGDEFEVACLEILENIKERGLFGIKEYLKITPKAKYYSELRKGYIEFDLVIEFCPPESENTMLTYFIECKNYKKRVPVDQVQKFHSDIMQVSGVNAKGIIISNGPFQKSAFNFAKSTGMMIIEGESVKDFKIVHYKRSLENNAGISFIKDSIDNSLLDKGTKVVEKLIDEEILKLLVESNSDIAHGIDKLSKKEIDEIAENELNKINQDYLINAYALNVKELKEFIKNEYKVKVQYFPPKGNTYLGTCNIDEKVIGLSKKIVNTSRELFVLGHEFGHFILHQKLSINQELLNSFSDSEFDFSTGKHQLKNPRHWIEWQANYFSISLLLPKTSIIAKTWQYSGSQTNLFLNDNHVNKMRIKQTIQKLANHFNVSNTSIVYRLQELGMITDNTSVKSIGSIISDWKSKFFV